MLKILHLSLEVSVLYVMHLQKNALNYFTFALVLILQEILAKCGQLQFRTEEADLHSHQSSM